MDPDKLLANIDGESRYIDRTEYKELVDLDIAAIQDERDLLEPQNKARLQELHISPQERQAMLLSDTINFETIHWQKLEVLFRKRISDIVPANEAGWTTQQELQAKADLMYQAHSDNLRQLQEQQEAARQQLEQYNQKEIDFLQAQEQERRVAFEERAETVELLKENRKLRHKLTRLKRQLAEIQETHRNEIKEMQEKINVLTGGIPQSLAFPEQVIGSNGPSGAENPAISEVINAPEESQPSIEANSGPQVAQFSEPDSLPAPPVSSQPTSDTQPQKKKSWLWPFS